MKSLRGEVIAVTGAAKRIGRSIAIELARRGARVAVHYHRSHEEAVATAAECGGKAFRADLCCVDQIRNLFGEIGRSYGRLDALVNNAAVFRQVDPLEATEEDWDSIHAVNLRGTFFCCQQAARLMRRTGGGASSTSVRSAAFAPGPSTCPTAHPRPGSSCSHGDWRRP